MKVQDMILKEFKDIKDDEMQLVGPSSYQPNFNALKRK
jgi:hypothetical protein